MGASLNQLCGEKYIRCMHVRNYPSEEVGRVIDGQTLTYLVNTLILVSEAQGIRWECNLDEIAVYCRRACTHIHIWEVERNLRALRKPTERHPPRQPSFKLQHVGLSQTLLSIQHFLLRLSIAGWTKAEVNIS